MSQPLTPLIHEAMDTGRVTVNGHDPEQVRLALIEARDLLPDDNLGNVPRWRENLTTAINALEIRR